jgi:hypothetical protein
MRLVSFVLSSLIALPALADPALGPWTRSRDRPLWTGSGAEPEPDQSAA